ncbi:MAG TPA: flagellar export protein FliJ [Baekduia sp.]|nr:flagellar export protein FliJ [Baekduia sp.]
MSSPFRFGLERVREIRVHDEEQAKEQFAASLSERVRGEALLRAAEARVEQARTQPAAASVGDADGRITGLSLLSRQAWVDRLERSRQDAEVQLRGLEAELARRRESLTAASRRREVLDKLKDRQREAHRRDAERREGAELDEMALRVHGRRAA